jgi:lysylphosphatidylglycerol synthetase-like protein (DUF2156 family)
MDSAMIFGLVLAVLFFGGITWLIIHTRLQERTDSQAENQASSVTKSELRKTGTDSSNLHTTMGQRAVLFARL